MNLCTYSKSRLCLVRSSCPLTLTQQEGRKCPCRRRECHPLGIDGLVLQCLYPRTWQEIPIRVPFAFAWALRRHLAEQKEAACRTN